MMSLVPEMDKVFQLIVQEEEQRNINGVEENRTEATTLMVQRKTKFTKPVGNVNKNEERCTGCKKTGHDYDNCYFVHGFPEGHPLHGKKFPRRDCKDREKKPDRATNYHKTAEETKGNELIVRQNMPDLTFTGQQFSTLMNKLNLHGNTYPDSDGARSSRSFDEYGTGREAIHRTGAHTLTWQEPTHPRKREMTQVIQNTLILKQERFNALDRRHQGNRPYDHAPVHTT